MRTCAPWLIKFSDRPAARLPPLPPPNLQDTAAEPKEPVIGESEAIGVLRFGFLFPFVFFKEITRAGHDGMGSPEAMAPEVPDLLRPFR